MHNGKMRERPRHVGYGPRIIATGLISCKLLQTTDVAHEVGMAAALVRVRGSRDAAERGDSMEHLEFLAHICTQRQELHCSRPREDHCPDVHMAGGVSWTLPLRLPRGLRLGTKTRRPPLRLELLPARLLYFPWHRARPRCPWTCWRAPPARGLADGNSCNSSWSSGHCLSAPGGTSCWYNCRLASLVAGPLNPRKIASTTPRGTRHRQW